MYNIGTFNVHELFWMLQCNQEWWIYLFHPKYTFFFCGKLGIAVHEWERKTLCWVVPHSIRSLSFVFPWYIWCKFNKLLKYNKDQFTKRWLEGKFEGFFGDSQGNVAHRIPNNYEYQDFYHCSRWLHHHNSRGFHVRFYSTKQSLTLTT